MRNLADDKFIWRLSVKESIAEIVNLRHCQMSVAQGESMNFIRHNWTVFLNQKQ